MRLKIPQVARRSNTSALEYNVCRLFVRDTYIPLQVEAVLIVEFADEFVTTIVRIDAEADGLINESSTGSSLSR